MKYYYREHMKGYRQVKDEGKTAWAEIHGETGFENFASREFLETALPMLHFSAIPPIAFEYGCGTGPGACFLAERGFRVDASDLIPLAIEIAREQAEKRNLDIHYEVMDICELPHDGKKYDLIVDSYCLQGIVTEEDRNKVFAAVRARLKPESFYLISSAVFNESRFKPNDTVPDKNNNILYNRYGDNLVINMQTCIVYTMLKEGPDNYEDAIQINGVWYLPVRRHRRPHDLKAELEASGFNVSFTDIPNQNGEHMVCRLR